MKHCSPQKCHTPLRTKAEDSLLSLYIGGLRKDLPKSYVLISYQFSGSTILMELFTANVTVIHMFLIFFKQIYKKKKR